MLAHQEDRLGGASQHASSVTDAVLRAYGFGNAVDNVEDVGSKFLAEIDAVSATQAPNRIDLWKISFYEDPAESLRRFDFDSLAHDFVSSLNIVWFPILAFRNAVHGQASLMR
jgi:hypothetical protein